MEGEWWTGSVGARSGQFPSNCVERILPQTAIPVAAPVGSNAILQSSGEKVNL